MGSELPHHSSENLNCPQCGHELDLPPPLPEVSLMSIDLVLEELDAVDGPLSTPVREELRRVGEEAAANAVAESLRDQLARTAMKLESEELRAMAAVARRVAAIKLEEG